MSQQILNIAQQAMDKNSTVLAKTKADVSAFDCESNPLDNRALSRYVDFLLQADLVTLEQGKAIKTYDDVSLVIVEALTVIKVLKRAMAFSLGNITLLANKYGCMAYFVNKDFPLKGWCCEEHPWCDNLIMDVFKEHGVTTSPVGGGEYLHDYSPLKSLIQSKAA